MYIISTMGEKETVYLLSNILSTDDGKGVNRNYIAIIKDEEIPILCIKQSENKKRLMPFKVLNDNKENFWLFGGNWQYYLTSESLEKLKKKSKTTPGAWEQERPKQEEPPEIKTEAVSSAESALPEEELEELQPEVGYGNEYREISKLSAKEKVDRLQRNKDKLDELLSAKIKDTQLVNEALVDTTKDAALINHAALEEAMILGDDEAKRFMQDFVDSTSEMVKSSAQLISEDVLNNELMNTLVKKSNGTIVQHMTRVYLNGIAFLAYYNNLVTTTSAIQKLRISFASKYLDFYQSLLPHLHPEDLDMENVFYGGMRAIPPELLFKWAVGFLIHDIGKAAAIEYHEGEGAYDRNKVMEHVKAGYRSIMTKTNYPMEASLITGYHHEYYGSQDGYGYFRAYLHQYKQANPNAKQDFCITYDLEPMLDYKALAYFPAKVLEIIDVYDSVTDPHRVYRKPMTPEEALTMMRKEFVENHKKLDVILFDIFADFTRNKKQSNL